VINKSEIRDLMRAVQVTSQPRRTRAIFGIKEHSPPSTARRHVAQVEVDVKTARARRLRQQPRAEATNPEPTRRAAVARGRLTATTRASGANRSQPIDTSWSIESS
jgi:hypothetical protein